MRVKYLKLSVVLSVFLLLMSNILPSVVYASEASTIQSAQAVQAEMARIDAKLSQNYLFTEQDIQNLAGKLMIGFLAMVASTFKSN